MIYVSGRKYIWNGSIIEKTCFILLAYEKKRNDMPCTNILFWVKSTSKLGEARFTFIIFSSIEDNFSFCVVFYLWFGLIPYSNDISLLANAEA